MLAPILSPPWTLLKFLGLQLVNFKESELQLNWQHRDFQVRCYLPIGKVDGVWSQLQFPLAFSILDSPGLVREIDFVALTSVSLEAPFSLSHGQCQSNSSIAAFQPPCALLVRNLSQLHLQDMNWGEWLQGSRLPSPHSHSVMGCVSWNAFKQTNNPQSFPDLKKLWICPES